MTVKVPSSWNTIINANTEPPLFVMHASTALINGESPDIGETGEGWVDWQFTGEGNYGLLDSWLVPILGFMEANAIPYKAVEDSKYEFQGEYRVFDGFVVHSVPYASDQCVLSESDWLGILDRCDGPRSVVEAVQDHFATPDFAQVSVAHLPAECPQLPVLEVEL